MHTAYNHPNHSHVLHWSNPNVSVNGHATGLNNKWNVLALNFNVPTVAAFRGSPSFYVTVTGPGSADGGEQLNFQASWYNHQSPVSSTWEVNTGSGYFYAGSGTSLNYTMPMNSDLQVKFSATDGGGNSDSEIRNVMNNFLGGGCGVCPFLLFSEIEASDEDFEDNLVTIYPNPTYDMLQLKIPDEFLDHNIELKVFDQSGKNLHYEKYEKINLNVIDLNVSTLDNGIYYVKLSSHNNIITSKFIKLRE